jgi:hypothetical protein
MLVIASGTPPDFNSARSLSSGPYFVVMKYPFSSSFFSRSL